MIDHNSDYHEAHWTCQGPAGRKEPSVFIALSLLLAAACVVPGAAKLSGQPKMITSARHFGIPWSRYRLIGAAELAAAAGVVAGMSWAPIGVAAASGMAVLLLSALA